MDVTPSSNSVVANYNQAQNQVKPAAERPPEAPQEARQDQGMTEQTKLQQTGSLGTIINTKA